MNKFVLFALLLAAPFSASPLHAWTLRLPKTQPAITITIPNTWKTKEKPAGYSAESPDLAAHMVFEVIPEEKLKDHIGETMDWLVLKQSVALDKATQQKGDMEANGLKWKTLKWDGLNSVQQPATIMLAFAGIGNGEVLMITYWIAKSSEAALQTEITDILGSVKISSAAR